MKKVIVIPIYKTELTETEIVSLKQCFKVLNQHIIKFVAPKNLDVSFYSKILGNNILVEYFPESYFSGISAYNSLMLSSLFYERFLEYEFILIYQLDCYVFRDELDQWCEKGYDYIGAPWLYHSFYTKTRPQKLYFYIQRYFKNNILRQKYNDKDILINNVGNGGFSLRHVSRFLSVIKNTNEKKLAKFSNSNQYSMFNEDIFWSFEASQIKKPSYKIASQFSLETRPDMGMKINQGKLPFGCHAWQKQLSYWEKYINL